LATELTAVVTLDLLSGIIALLVSYYAFRVMRVVQSGVLSAISFGFMLLGAALLVEVLTSLSLGLTAANVRELKTVEIFENLVYLLLQVLALGVIAFGYTRTAFGKRDLPAAALSGVVGFAVTAASRTARLEGLKLALYNSFLGLEFVVLFLLLFIIFSGLLVYTKSRSSSSLLVLVGFALIFAAHLVVLNSIFAVSGVEYAEAAAIQFLGFLSLLAFVIRSGRVGST
jgi:hypothetical protein